MRIIQFSTNQLSGVPRLGALLHEWVVGLPAASLWAQEHIGPGAVIPHTAITFLQAGEEAWDRAREILDAIEAIGVGKEALEGFVHPRELVRLHEPVSNPPTLRDFYAFEQHVATANANRGRTVPEEWYRFPVFYFSNPSALFGPDETVPRPGYTQALDYELEVACVIGRTGKNIPPEQGEEYTFGYTVFNDWSARDVQGLEMRVGLGPAKGKDFASSFGPSLVTPDELAEYHAGRPGVYNLSMTARVNSEERSRGNWNDLHYSFGEMIARASEGVTLYPGDIIGSGTVGTGCLLELTAAKGPWLQPGDEVALEIEGLGILCNTVGVAAP